MNICVVTHTFPRYANDNVAPFMKGLCRGLVKSGNTVHVFMPEHAVSKIEKKPEPFTIHRYRYMIPRSLQTVGYSGSLTNDRKLKITSYLFAPFLIVSGIINLYLLVKRKNIEIISAHWILPNGFIGAVVSKLTGIPLVSTLPGSDVYLAGFNSLFRSMAQYAGSQSVCITSNSPQLKKDLELYGVPVKRFEPIVYGVDIDAMEINKKRALQVRSLYSCTDKDIMILGVGRLVEKKGFIHLLRAVVPLVKNNTHIKLLLVGEGDERKHLEKYVKEHAINKKVLFTGQISYDQLPYYYQAADIFVLPSIRDKDGNLDDQSVSVVEAMAVGLPVVTSDFPGYRLVIDDGKDGFLVPEKNEHALFKILRKLIVSETLRNTIGENARVTVQKRLTWEKIGAKYTKLFRDLLST